MIAEITIGKSGALRRQRALTAVLGLVILVGVVAVGSITLLLVADESTTELERQAESERVEGTFVELSRQVETASLSGDVDRVIDLTFDEQLGTVERKSTGGVTVRIGGAGVANATLGTIEYRGTDGTTLAYQSGGVWRGTGDESIAVSEPPVHVREGTLNLPIYSIVDHGHVSSGKLRLSSLDTTAAHSGSIESVEPLTVTVTTEYYGGWERYFESFENASVERHSAPGDLEAVEVTFATSAVTKIRSPRREPDTATTAQTEPVESAVLTTHPSPVLSDPGGFTDTLPDRDRTAVVGDSRYRNGSQSTRSDGVTDENERLAGAADDGSDRLAVDPGTGAFSAPADRDEFDTRTVRVGDGDPFQMNSDRSPHSDARRMGADDGIRYLHVTTHELALGE